MAKAKTAFTGFIICIVNFLLFITEIYLVFNKKTNRTTKIVYNKFMPDFDFDPKKQIYGFAFGKGNVSAYALWRLENIDCYSVNLMI